MTAGTTPAGHGHAGIVGRLVQGLARLGVRHLVVAAVLPIILLLLLGAMLLARGSGTPTAIGTVAPDFSLTTLDGEPISLADLRGRPVIVNFWASWCLPCVEEFPILADAHERHADEGLAVVGVVYQDTSLAARTFLERQGAEWPSAADPDGRAAEAYGILAPPETFLIDRDGVIVARALGQFSAEWLDEKVAAIMER
jgi:cytochrome c biogenesis protein CcmG, thiol:disulfide interchange protein DsbE